MGLRTMSAGFTGSRLGSRNNAGVFSAAVDLVGRHQAQVRHLITHRFTLHEAPRAIAFALEHPAEVEKVIIQVAGAT
ncbi:MAG TPA: hypothetical protein VFE42_07040 [Chloroflexota bacterium]|nr:hypothetical protein [Chloroflexota bacterium]